MDIYVMKDGTRRGPFLPFKLREMLEEKEILPSDPGWIEDMEQWQPLKEIEALRAWMPPDPSLPPPLPTPEEMQERTRASAQAAAALAAADRELAAVEARPARAWLRLGARMLDEILWFMVVWAAGVSAGWLELSDFFYKRPLLLVLPPVLWIPVEALLISRFRTTPGKWLFGMQVVDARGESLSWTAALKRSALVLVAGNGCGLPVMLLLPVVQGGMAWMLYRRTGTTLWDRAATSQVLHASPQAAGFAGAGLIVVGWMALAMWLMLTAPLPAGMPAAQRGQIEEMRQRLAAAKAGAGVQPEKTTAE